MAYELVRVGEKLPYSFEWTSYLAGRTITTYAWSIDPSAGITLTGATTATVVVEGFTAGTVYELSLLATLNDGAKATRRVNLRCQL